MTLRDDVDASITALDLTPADHGAARLAREYADLIDNAIGDGHRDDADRAWALRWIGPLLLDTLEALGATPAARARLKDPKTTQAPESPLDKLRAARAAGTAPRRKRA